ncbi:MAG: hypothetical protein IID44_20815 [Planctomycetes bacterium]|nr:hypothetical protein [Planctomycetota bacterium]
MNWKQGVSLLAVFGVAGLLVLYSAIGQGIQRGEWLTFSIGGAVIAALAISLFWAFRDEF